MQLRLERPALKAAVALARLTAEDRLIDVATGTGAVLALLPASMPEAAVVGVDSSAAMLRVARRRWPGPLVCADARGLPFGDRAFSVATCAFFLHVATEETRNAALRELHRVLRPNGRLVTVTPARSNAWWIRVARGATRVILTPALASTFRAYDPSDDLMRAGFRIETSRLVRRGYPSQCVLSRRLPSSSDGASMAS